MKELKVNEKLFENHKIERKEKRKQERKEKKIKNIQNWKRNRGIKEIPKEDSEKPKKKKKIEKEDSDIEDDILDPKELSQSGGIYITPEMMKSVLEPEDEDLKIIKILEKKLGLDKKEKKQESKGELKKYIKEKKQQVEILEGVEELENITSGKYEEEYDKEYELLEEEEYPELNEKQEQELKEVIERGIPKEEEEYKKLEKQIRGLMNKISYSNMIKMIEEMIEIYENNIKNHFYEIIIEMIMNSLNNNMTIEMILCYSSLIVILNEKCGIEIGSIMIEKIIMKENKNNNDILFLSYLYKYEMIESILIFEFINEKLLIKLDDIHLEFIYLILKNVGFQLRNDQPQLLKKLIQDINEKKSLLLSKKSQFLFEMLDDLKNNKKKGQDTEQFKNYLKIVNHFLKEKNKLKISLKDYLNIHKKGKWWIIGNSWIGREKEEKVKENNDLEKLAKQQRIVGDIRKKIFFILMSSEDSLDAFSKLVKLGIHKNDKEICNLIIHCCCQEKIYNPYYYLLSTKLCSSDYNISRTFQFSFNHQFKEMNSFSIQKLVNLSHLLSQLILNQSISISILKFIDFNLLEKNSLLFTRFLFILLILGNDFELIFKKLSKMDHLDILKDSLKSFLFSFLDKENSFLNDLLPIKDPSQKDNLNWIQENVQLIRKRTKIIYKIISY